MTSKLQRLRESLHHILGGRIASLEDSCGQLTLEVMAGDYLSVAAELRDHPELRFEQLIDLCGVDYSAYKDGTRDGRRFAAVAQLLSVSQNVRLRMRAFCPDDGFPVPDSLTQIWPSVSWFEREAFDLFGIVFSGHPDLRRILTDYGFIGHPFRKDFPISGHVEMRYDPDQRRVTYQPVTIDPRENTPRIAREENYAEVDQKK